MNKYEDVINLSRVEKLKLRKENLTKNDFKHPIPIDVYPNLYTKILGDKITTHFYKDDDNLYALMTYLGIDLSYDVITGTKDGKIPFKILRNSSQDEEILYNHLVTIISKNGFPKEMVNHLLDFHHSNPINQLVDMCASEIWDGVDRLHELKNCLKVPKDYDTWKDICIEKWLIQCVAAWDNTKHCSNLEARNQFDTVLILSGSQGSNKSSFFGKLLPKEVNKYFKSGLNLDVKNKDSLQHATSYGISELGEIDSTFTKSATSLLKAFLSDEKDSYREPYAKKITIKPRHTSYCGTVNDTEFLRDMTGNRRYYPLQIESIDMKTFANIDKQQLWAQIWEYYINGKSWWLTENTEEWNIHNLILEKHEEINPTLDAIKSSFSQITNNEKGLTTKQIHEHISKEPYNKKHGREINAILRKLNIQNISYRNVNYWDLKV